LLIKTLFFYQQTRQYAIEKATEKIEEVLLNTQALRKYVSIQKNEVYRLQDEGWVDKEYFSPILLSSTYVSKQVNNIYNHLREQKAKEAITIRFAAPNPRNEANTATPKEIALLNLFNEKKLDSYKELIQTPRGEAIYFATPTQITTGECAVCHTDPALAPKGLVQMYGDTNGFYEHSGEIRAILSTTYPIQTDLADAKFFFYLLSFATFVVLFAILLMSYKFINIIKQKQNELEDANKNLEAKVDEQIKELSDQHRYLDLILNSSPNIILVSDVEKIIYANDAFTNTFYCYESIADFNEKERFKHFIFKRHCCDTQCKNLEKTKDIDKESWLDIFLNNPQKLYFNDKGDEHFYNMTTTTIHHDDRNLYLHIITDISELERTKLQLQELSVIDDLTKLHNRRYFNQVYTNEVQRSAREGNYFVFAIFDIDYFKHYNDALGHVKGDAALQKIAQTIQKHFSRSGDYTFRMGGEEFCIITTTDTKESVKKHILQFHSAIKQLQIVHPKSDVSEFLTLSIGVYAAKVSKENPQDFYKEADALLYRAKQKRDSVVFNF